MPMKKYALSVLILCAFIFLAIPSSAYTIIHQEYTFNADNENLGGKFGVGQIFNQTSDNGNTIWNITHIDIHLKMNAGKTNYEAIRLRIFNVSANTSYPVQKYIDMNLTTTFPDTTNFYWKTFELPTPFQMDSSLTRKYAICLSSFDSDDDAYSVGSGSLQISTYHQYYETDDITTQSDSDAMWTSASYITIKTDRVVLYKLKEVISPVNDTENPTLLQISPENDAIVSSNSPTITAIYYDNSSIDVSQTYIWVNNVNKTLESSISTGGIIYQTSDLDEGQYMVKILITDNSPNHNSEYFFWNFTVSIPLPEDTTPPSIDNILPLNNTNISDTTPSIFASYSDLNGIDTDSLIMYLNDDNITDLLTITSSSCSYVPTTQLSLGNYSIILNVSDDSENHNTASVYWNFTIIPIPTNDTTPPSIIFTNPNEGQELSDTTPLISANYSDDTGINLNKIYLTVNGINLTTFSNIEENGIYFNSPFHWDGGAYTATLIVYDSSSNENKGIAYLNFTIETIPEQPDTGDDDGIIPEEPIDEGRHIHWDNVSILWWFIPLLIGAIILLYLPFQNKKQKRAYPNIPVYSAVIFLIGLMGFLFWIYGYTPLDLYLLQLYYWILIVGIATCISGILMSVGLAVPENQKGGMALLLIGILVIFIGIIIWAVMDLYKIVL